MDAERDGVPDVVASAAAPGGVGGGGAPRGTGAAGGAGGSGSTQPPPAPVRPPPPATAPVVVPPVPTMMPPVPTGMVEDPKRSDECIVLGSQATEVDCSIELTCPESYIVGRCEVAGGEANCFCDNKRGYSELRLTGVSAKQACEVLAAECENASINPAAAPSCALDSESVGKGSCDADRECSHAVQTVSGVSISTVTRNGVHCSDQVGAWSCDCFGTPADRSFVFETSAEPRDACRQALDICDEAALTPVVAAACEIDELVVSPSDCSIVQECRSEGTTQSGIDIDSVESRRAVCSAGEPGVGPEPGGLPPEERAWPCECHDGCGRRGQPFVVSASDSLSACQNAATACRHIF